MSFKISPNFLRYVLCADAISCLACGIFQIALSEPLSSRLGLQAGPLGSAQRES